LAVSFWIYLTSALLERREKVKIRPSEPYGIRKGIDYGDEPGEEMNLIPLYIGGLILILLFILGVLM
jgi:hypothetical protein